MATYKRKKKLINLSLQIKLISVFLCVSLIASLFQVMLLNRALVGLSKLVPDASETLLAHLPSVLTTNLVLTLAVLFPLTFLVGVLVTHRVAGPAYRLQQHCLKLARGEEPGRCFLRKDDELQELCDAMNRAFESLGQENKADSGSKATQPGDGVQGLVDDSQVSEEPSSAATEG